MSAWWRKGIGAGRGGVGWGGVGCGGVGWGGVEWGVSTWWCKGGGKSQLVCKVGKGLTNSMSSSV